MPVRWTQGLLASAVLLLAFSMTGCSTQAKRVDCYGHLRPINHPAPPAAVSAAAKDGQSRDGKLSDEK